ncbi:RNA polymerase sigma-70 factor (ECF subfamily) [Inhella inkyongensis]|uniref:RNA polymerase sigma-70 factor (ECF subfamily) n=1 Tax=Inhella inkyongensis TaxID=392593 RepID=A0A840S0G6_9BURK|nr:sigma-70 family RNA polymerase sigma factor [Inhella inkyongensis]MBB5204567.1 RNA polymerase sigma-70 factor (ECF subfamily) [Inhella inkyongensis]
MWTQSQPQAAPIWPALLGAFSMDDIAQALSPPQTPNATSLEACLLAIVDQDEAAFARLYKALSARVHALALRILREPAAAEEVVEDCFWQVWRQAARFDPARGNAEAWVLTLARSRALDAYRARARSTESCSSLEALQEQGFEPDGGDAEHDGAELLAASRSHQALHQALLQLGAQPRQLLGLAFFRGLSHEEIAEQTALPLGTIKSQIRRALATLKPLLEGQR